MDTVELARSWWRDGATRDALAVAVAAARGRGDRFLVSLRDDVDDRFRGVVADLGLLPAGDAAEA